MRRLLATILVGSLLVGCGDEPPPRRDPALLDIVVITLDTVRADRLGCYGYFRDTTPTIDAFAREALVFGRCVAPVSQTLPSHTSLLTGLFPYEHGLLANRYDRLMYVRAPGATSIATVLSELGYETAAFISAEPLKREAGLGEGFEVWWEPNKKSVTADVVVTQALRWLAAPHDRPVFLWLHLFDAHLPYAPPAPYDTWFPSDAVQEAYLSERRVMEKSQRYTAVEAHNLYDGEIRYMDDQLAPLFDALRKRGTWDDGLIVVTADHGEELLQHFSNGHGTLWHVSMHVPFVLKAPGLSPGRTQVPLTLADVLPTAFGRAPGLQARLDGWLTRLSGRDVLAPQAEPRALIGQHAIQGGKDLQASAILDGEWRLIVGVGRDKLFNLGVDPHELQNVADDHPDIVERLRRALDTELDRQRARGVLLGAGETRVLEPERAEGLDALGYTGDGGDEDG